MNCSLQNWLGRFTTHQLLLAKVHGRTILWPSTGLTRTKKGLSLKGNIPHIFLRNIWMWWLSRISCSGLVCKFDKEEVCDLCQLTTLTTTRMHVIWTKWWNWAFLLSILYAECFKAVSRFLRTCKGILVHTLPTTFEMLMKLWVGWGHAKGFLSIPSQPLLKCWWNSE